MATSRPSTTSPIRGPSTYHPGRCASTSCTSSRVRARVRRLTPHRRSPDVEVAVRHNPGFALALVQLGPREECRAESGAKMATSGGLDVLGKADAGYTTALKRIVSSGHSFV